MCPAGGLDDWSRPAISLVEPVEPSIGVCLHQSGVADKMLLGMLAAAITRIEQHRRRRIGPAKRRVVAHIGPQAAGTGLVLRQDRHGRIVGGMDALGGEDMCFDHVHQRHQRRRGGTHPVSERRHVKIDAFARA
jgi:hypothetical protein